jgi:hypothetical protein
MPAKKTKTEDGGADLYVMRSDVGVCSPSLEYAPLDRQIMLFTMALDGNGDDITAECETLYSTLTSYFSGQPDSLDELKALEDCLLFGLTEIAKQRAKLSQ